MAEPMITIKKADGTFAKVSLSEFKKMQSGQQKPAEPVKPSAPAPDPVVMHHKSVPASHPVQHHKPAHHAPAHTKSHTEHTKTVYHPAKHMTRTDAGSLLEEKIPVKGHGVLFSPKREKQVEMVIGKLGFSVAPDLLGRLKSLVLARLKDIKSEDEARELLSRSVKNGGLGLTEQQVEKILQSCHEAAELEHGHEIDAPVLKGKTGMLPMVEPPELPMVISASPPYQGGARGGLPSSASVPQTTATPLTSPLGKGGMTTVANVRQNVDVVSKFINQTAANEPVFKLNTQAAVRKSMQDVSAATAEMGPAEEIKSTTLTDFRRLSGNPEEAARRLQQKMFNLQDESFVLYLDALAAYRASPLYNEYMRAICQSLAERKTLASILAMKNSIKLNEVEAIVEMERGL